MADSRRPSTSVCRLMHTSSEQLGMSQSLRHNRIRETSLVYNKKLIMRWEYTNVTWRISSYLFTYVRLSIDIHWTGNSPISNKMNHTQVMKSFELELDFAEYIHYYSTLVLLPLLEPLYTIYRVTSYLRLLVLSILICNPNMSFLVRFISDNSRSLGEFELGHCPLQPPRHP